MRTELSAALVVVALLSVAAAKDEDFVVALEDQRDPIDASLPVCVYIPVSSDADLDQTTNKLREVYGNRWQKVEVKKVKTRGRTKTEEVKKHKKHKVPAAQEPVSTNAVVVIEMIEWRPAPDGEAYQHAALWGIVVTNKAEFVAARAMWEPRFIGRNYEIRAHWHYHAAKVEDQTPCRTFTVRGTNGVENAKALDDAFAYDGRHHK